MSLTPPQGPSAKTLSASLLFCVGLCVVIPAITFVPGAPVWSSFSPKLVIVAKQIFVFAIVLAGGVLFRTRSTPRAVWIYSWIVSGLYTCVYFLIAYRLSTGMVFELRFAVDALPDISRTLTLMFGWSEVASLFLLVVLLLVLQRFLWILFTHQKWPLASSPGVCIVGLAVATSLLPEDAGYLVPVGADAMALMRQGELIMPLSDPPRYIASAENRGDNLVFLQLESLSAVAGFGQASIGGTKFSGDYLPQLKRLASHGVMFPFMWANGVQTSRAVASTLCGIAGNIGSPISYHPDRIVGPCLPELLRQANYSSSYMLGYQDPAFHRLESLVRQKGFDEILGPELLDPGDPVAVWGFEECNFFRRVFRHLREQRPNPERTFLYIAVSRHHFRFRADPLKQDLHPLPGATSEIGEYFNSLAEQDACLAVFWDEYVQYAGDNSHLFLFGDHSWPLGIDGQGEYPKLHAQNFLTPLVYVPPLDDHRFDERRGTTSNATVSQADFGATALDLLGIDSDGNSFAPLLEGDEAAEYEQCQVLGQPYGTPAVVVARPSERYAYLPEERKVLHWTLLDDNTEGPPSVVREGVSYAEFREAYGCSRYRD